MENYSDKYWRSCEIINNFNDERQLLDIVPKMLEEFFQDQYAITVHLPFLNDPVHSSHFFIPESQNDVTIHLANNSNKAESAYQLYCGPLKETQRFILITIQCRAGLNNDSIDILKNLARHLLFTLRRIESQRREASVSDKSLLSLIKNLTEARPHDLQRTLNKHLMDKLGAANVLILYPLARKDFFITNALGEVSLLEPIEIFASENIFSHSFNNGEIIILNSRDQIPEIYSDLKLNMEIDNSMIVPIKLVPQENVEFLIVVINKSTGYLDIDKEIILTTMKYVSNTILLSFKYTEEKLLVDQSQSLLKMTKNIFKKIGNLASLLKEIMNEAKRITRAERCSVFLLNESRDTLVASVFDGVEIAENDKTNVIRIPMCSGVAGHVASTGEILNIKDAYSYELFYKEIDVTTGFKTRNILCFPIKDDAEEIIGVAQLCNKINGAYFTEEDEKLAQIFSVYCCISIVHSITCERLQKAKVHNKLANEIMSYHMMTVEDKSVQQLVCKTNINLDKILPDWNKFCSIPRNVTLTDSEEFIFGLSEQLDVVGYLQIPKHYLAKFILMTRLGYRDTPYHNWTHAFTVAHFSFLCIKNFCLIERNHLTRLEATCLFLASLCHDIDHRGTTNSFQVKSKSVLASLYSSEGSVLERHHLSQMICIISSENCTLFENFEGEKYTQVLDILKHIILSTDLAHHFKIFDEVTKMAESGFDTSNPKHHDLLLCILMTSSDLSDQTKSWSNVVNVAELVYQEFFRQGDLEKAMGNQIDASMDRERACIPNLQINFLDHVLIPCYTLVYQLYPEFGNTLDNLNENRRKWLLKYEEEKNHNRLS